MIENNQSISPNSVSVYQVPASQVIGEPGHEGEFIQMYSYAKKAEVQDLKENIQNDIQTAKDRMLVL
ncbi:hypothetical protein [Lactococcus lactis]|uniref:hypothetical protein n=1 Tax=Lactococcus lactis TaxID=1358 RepID=UPI0022B8A410|nr:hypothetical protein [Lactococcus lactis]MCZ8492019.1 hypothetical protein [Lactococcus lactis]